MNQPSAAVRDRQLKEGLEERPVLPMLRFVLGTVLVMTPLGQILCWGRLKVTLQRYLEYKSDSSIESMQSVNVCMWMAFAVSIAAFGRLVEASRSPKSVVLVGSATGGLALMLSSLCTSVASLTICYGILFGVACGAYIVPLYYVTQSFPHTLGVMIGFATSCFATGEIVTYYFMGYLLDLTQLPLNDEEEIPYENFKHVPSMFRYSAMLFMCSVLVGGFLLPEPKEIMVHGVVQYSPFISFQPEEENRPRFAKVKKWYFWLLPTMTYISFTAGTLVAMNYVDVGVRLTSISRDTASKIGDWAVISGIIGRLIWGLIADAFGYHNALLAVGVSMASLVLSFGFIHNTGLFHFWSCLLYFAWSGNAAVLPTTVAELFGSTDFTLHFSITYAAAAGGILSAALLSTPFTDSFDNGQASLMVMAFIIGTGNMLIFPLRYYNDKDDAEHLSGHPSISQTNSGSARQGAAAAATAQPNVTGTTNKTTTSSHNSSDQPEFFSAFRSYSRTPAGSYQPEISPPRHPPRRFSTLPRASSFE
eukprot:TRINITY_DN23644_c0_g1_i1.p1 TRINITY_DN23644_c0_g1~~TRINITY_DN23644_c0_g1_i1.p1  ORF type:complete len:554 (+),score=72.54 TRINITY_DN23644_c0_g1_i1:66-1664(+)